MSKVDPTHLLVDVSRYSHTAVALANGDDIKAIWLGKDSEVDQAQLRMAQSAATLILGAVRAFLPTESIVLALDGPTRSRQKDSARCARPKDAREANWALRTLMCGVTATSPLAVAKKTLRSNPIGNSRRIFDRIERLAANIVKEEVLKDQSSLDLCVSVLEAANDREADDVIAFHCRALQKQNKSVAVLATDYDHAYAAQFDWQIINAKSIIKNPHELVKKTLIDRINAQM